LIIFDKKKFIRELINTGIKENDKYADRKLKLLTAYYIQKRHIKKERL